LFSSHPEKVKEGHHDDEISATLPDLAKDIATRQEEGHHEDVGETDAYGGGLHHVLHAFGQLIW
jgi:hypothetical protein